MIKKSAKRKPHKLRRTPVLARGAFTLMDEVMASPVQPLPASVTEWRIETVQAALARMALPGAATVGDWSLCCVAGNVLETMLSKGLVADPDGLLQDAFSALRTAAGLLQSATQPAPLAPHDHALVAGMVEDWASVMREAPARLVVHCLRATDARVSAIESGRLQPHDFVFSGAGA